MMEDCKAIIIDDDVDLLSLYREILNNNEIKIVAYGSTGMDAVKLYKQHKPCCILLDMNMPKFDGNYAIKHIKEFDPDAKIIVMTGYPYIEPDLDDVFAVTEKPIDITDMLDLIKSTC